MPEPLVNNFLVGCDPEFLVADKNGDGVYLNTLTAYINYTFPPQVGVDHGGWVVELRPPPAKGTYALVRRIQRLLRSPRLREYEGFSWLAGAMRKGRAPTRPTCCQGECDNWTAFYDAMDRWDDGLGDMPLGGHIHLDIRPWDVHEGVADNWPELRALDGYTLLLEALDILPSEECADRRRHGHYGEYGDYHADKNRLEYRTMCSWLFHPKVTMLCLTGAKLAAAEPNAVRELINGDSSLRTLKRMFEAFATRDTNARRVVERILEPATRARDLQWRPDQDFREHWRTLGLGRERDSAGRLCV